MPPIGKFKRKPSTGRRAAARNRNAPRKPSYLEEHRIDFVDYKDIKVLQRFVNQQGKILPRRMTRLTPIQQHAMTRAVKRARHLALLPYTTDTEAY